MNNLDEIKHSVIALREFGVSRLRIATIPGLGFGYVPKLFARMLEINTKLNIYCDIMSTQEVVQHVESGHFNMGFVTLPVTSPHLQIDTIAKTKAVCVLPREQQTNSYGSSAKIVSPLLQKQKQISRDSAHWLVIMSALVLSIQSLLEIRRVVTSSPDHFLHI